MPVANQYSLSNRELTELIIKASDVHEGNWYLMVTFGFGALNAGQNEDDVVPTGLVSVQNIGIHRADEKTPAAMVVDAAQVNPAP
jgi:hypothetical protein